MQSFPILKLDSIYEFLDVIDTEGRASNFIYNLNVWISYSFRTWSWYHITPIPKIFDLAGGILGLRN